MGLARTDLDGQLRPTRAAILLFAEDPGGLLDSKCGIRVFQYRGDRIEHTPETNLLRPVRTIAGPLLVQIRDASNATLEALATGIQMGPLGFEVVQSYPVRVLCEAITNAVIHRDYRLQADIQIRIFANRVEVESPGLFPADVTVANIGRIGSRPRNRALVDHLREFPTPPNLDAGEGVRMMFQTMLQASLYPPLFLTQPDWSREAVLVVCFNEARADSGRRSSTICRLMLTSETRRFVNCSVPTILSGRHVCSKRWVDLGLLVVGNPAAAKQSRRYRRPGVPLTPDVFSMASGKQAKVGS